MADGGASRSSETDHLMRQENGLAAPTPILMPKLKTNQGIITRRGTTSQTFLPKMTIGAAVDQKQLIAKTRSKMQR